MLRIALALILFLSACATVPPEPRPVPGADAAPSQAEIRQRADRAARQFVRVVKTVEPVARTDMVLAEGQAIAFHKWSICRLLRPS